MRRDIGFYVEADLERVYNAYLQAATNKPFERTCSKEPFHTISFGVNYSFKYNMNGGSCNIHLMPCGSGTAVNMRFSIAQAVGARYERYAEDLNNAMRAVLPVLIRPSSYNMEDFLRPENQITPATLHPAPAPVVAPMPTPVITPAPVVAAAPMAAPAPVQAEVDIRYCVHCGGALTPGGRFCSGCGAPTKAAEEKICPNCQAKAKANDTFCYMCGTKL